MAKGYKQLNFEDRKKLEFLYNSGEPATKIAEALGVNQTTVCRELEKGRDYSATSSNKVDYSAVRAQAISNLAKDNKRRAQKSNKDKTKALIKEQMRMCPGITRKQIAKNIGRGYSTVLLYYDALKEELQEEIP